MLYLLHIPAFQVNWKQLAGRFRQITGAPADIEHPEISSALRFIAQNLSEPLDVDYVVSALPVGRRTLERRFARHLQVPIRRAITLVRLEIARQLLARTVLSVTQISVEVGFPSPSSMSNVFRRELGCSPRDIRRAVAVSASALSPIDIERGWPGSWTNVVIHCLASSQALVAWSEVCRQTVAHGEVFDASNQPAANLVD